MTHTEQEKKTLDVLRKRLFVLTAYVLVAAALFVYVSYSAYRLRLKGYNTLGQVEEFHASIVLTPTEDAYKQGEDVSVIYLADLRPGEDAQVHAYNDINDTPWGMEGLEETEAAVAAAKEAAKNRKIELVVNNYEVIDGAEMVADGDLTYSIKIYTADNLPLEFALVYHNEETEQKDVYPSATFVDWYYQRNYGFYLPQTSTTFPNLRVEGYATGSSATAKEVIFTLPGAQEGEPDSKKSHHFDIYVGWDTPKESWDNRENLDEKYRKEVEVLRVVAEIVAPPGSENVLPDDLPSAERLPSKPEGQTVTVNEE